MMWPRVVRLIPFFILALTVSPVWATPPREIKLSYDKEGQILHVEAQHPSDRLERHYLRRLVVTQNGKEVQVLNYPRQVLAWGFSNDVVLAAQENDVIKVELFCSQGGNGSGEIILPPEGKVE